MKKIFIDLEKCLLCQSCVVNCSYFYHPENNGIINLQELATFSLICRRCEEAPCTNSCYHNALKKDKDGILKRSNYLCTSCKSCSIACPFGTILVDFLVYLDSKCDFCIKTQRFLCVESCPYGAVEIKDIEKEDIEAGIFFVSQNLAVHTNKKWFSDDRILYRKK
ncbi:MAG: hypothetical protein NC925_04655 [Candidatus Omnitrophica bacterium]|nr:hypothetical protein [Candidatus Omnitrophota bacterium]MCM8830869.1 hypothetical protein [Candidatus Omnitrophota bacterium]